ncbi:MAG: hypothetical protein V7K67_30960 [Nostoc sp.]|uniref:hypothetical protein n=1 Tax=Nostoc sp. TaxID=1180 RepID=UPI002FFB327D
MQTRCHLAYGDRQLMIVLILRLESGLQLQILHPVLVMKYIAKIQDERMTGDW